MESTYKYDVALSFAGEQRYYVDVVARALFDYDLSIFYDELESAELWGTDGIEEFSRRYGEEAYRVVMFISGDYVRKGWPSIERRSTFGRLLKEPNSNHVLPVRFDDTPVPGLDPQRIVKHVSDELGPVELAEGIVDHLIVSGRIPSSVREHVGQARREAAQVGFTSIVDRDESGQSTIEYRIHNGSPSTIDSVVLVVPDYVAHPDASPDNQHGCAIELVIGPVAANQTIEGSVEFFMHWEPVFSELQYAGHLIWSDNRENHWSACGSRLQRRWLRARTC